MTDQLNNNPNSTKAEQSEFILLLGWVTMLASALSIAYSLVSTFITKKLFNEEINFMLNILINNKETPFSNFVHFIQNNHTTIMITVFTTSAVLIICSIYLLKGKDWARLSFIAFVTTHIVLNIYLFPKGHAIVGSFFTAFSELFASEGIPELAAELERMQRIFKTVSTISVTAITALLVWMVYKLNTKEIKAEFEG